MPGSCAVSGDGFPSSIPAALTIDAGFDAYFECRKHKRNAINQLRFEADLESNLVALYRDLVDGQYQIGRSIAFVIQYPKIREIWAADFRDRVVHHLIYNAVRERFERRFIRDSYACIPGRGTHDAMRRVSGFARSITHNWSRDAHFLKADIAHFFGSIDRHVLLGFVLRHVDEEWLRTLIQMVALHDPRANAVFRSSRALFARVPKHKSLLHAPEGKGLPIGNLTSQFFANIYLNELDQFVKHRLRAQYYGRYVDDIVLLHDDPGILNSWYDQIDGFLQDRLALRLHPGKKHLNRAATGIDFTGFIIKPGRTYLRQSSLARCRRKINGWERSENPYDPEALKSLSHSMNSYLGQLRQVDGYRAREAICRRVENLFLIADADCTKILPVKKTAFPSIS
jgi:retron-type reverse transcriptase